MHNRLLCFKNKQLPKCVCVWGGWVRGGGGRGGEGVHIDWNGGLEMVMSI